MFICLLSRKQSSRQHINTSINRNRHIKVRKEISYFENGDIQHEAWSIDGKYHRPDGAPAIIYYFKNGQIESKLWFKNGKRIHFKIL